MQKINKTEITKVVAEKTELIQKDPVAATQTVLDTITNALANGEKVQILGFGTFEVREQSVRTGHNPQKVKKCKSPLQRHLLLKLEKN
ncbi:HU family DNA-binding protein [Bacillus thuringiensis]|uniref:HU family DNA-binding protein n=1 Tax=Bacillus thuringiensis TaxID=1428 RepID=UPI0026D11C76